jgi:8-oxo-dGTP diphosphatase
MEIKHRIAAGALVIHEEKILLVRTKKDSESYLVGPGGAIDDGESLREAAEREVEEETGVKCRAVRAVMLENIRASRYQMLKVWYLCEYVSGAPEVTELAQKEDIIDVAWFGDEELANELVFPAIIKDLTIGGLAALNTSIIDPEVRFGDF